MKKYAVFLLSEKWRADFYKRSAQGREERVYINASRFLVTHVSSQPLSRNGRFNLRYYEIALFIKSSTSKFNKLQQKIDKRYFDIVWTKAK